MTIILELTDWNNRSRSSVSLICRKIPYIVSFAEPNHHSSFLDCVGDFHMSSEELTQPQTQFELKRGRCIPIHTFSHVDEAKEFSSHYKLFYKVEPHVEPGTIRVQLRKKLMKYEICVNIEGQKDSLPMKITELPEDIDLQAITPLLRTVQWGNEKRNVLEIEIGKTIRA